MENLLREIGYRCFLSPDLQERIKSDFKRTEFKKGDQILTQGNKSNNLFFIESGVLHNYYYHGGKQVSSWIYFDNQFITSWYSFFTQKQSFESIECLEDAILYEISYENYQKLIREFPAFGNFARLLAEEILVFTEEFSKGWSFLSAKEKYHLLLSHYPNIELIVKLGYIASLLGISQETLSRLRANN